ncbi:hypothetical protein CDAR_276221 [Caerostris darwini]|uniref:Uncharacterized protein n=1 Tax=Caerostris darwini TaxID=1538125 RepID=A0AAV4PXY7_9ARAC|nr:hypothetical protein CDAR_276221 [Caerostris darwini]
MYPDKSPNKVAYFKYNHFACSHTWGSPNSDRSIIVNPSRTITGGGKGRKPEKGGRCWLVVTDRLRVDKTGGPFSSSSSFLCEDVTTPGDIAGVVDHTEVDCPAGHLLQQNAMSAPHQESKD